MKFIVLGIILLSCMSLAAQKKSYDSFVPQNQTSSIAQKVHVQQDARIDSLLSVHVEMNKRVNGTDGYRLEIFFESGTGAREKALATKTDFLRKYQDVAAYISFLSPNFKVRVGDFRTKDEALKLKARIKRDYPNAFIVKDIIQFPELYSERSSNE